MRRCVLVVLVEIACLVPEDDGPPRIVDQSGAEFFWVCSEAEGFCTTHRIAGVSPPPLDCDDPSLADYGVAWDRFLAIYEHCNMPLPDTEQTRVETTRIVVCDDDRDCPEEAYFDPVFECRNGFCQNADVERYGDVRFRELFALCFGEEPRFTATERPSELEASVEASCPGGWEDWNVICDSIPPACPDPGPP